MCDKCIELDAKIERCRELATWIDDRLTLEAFKQLSDQLQAEKAALHPKD
jgi:hypothetical protein